MISPAVLLPPVLLVLAAHFLRAGEPALCAALVLFLGLAFTRRAWMRWGTAAVLAWGALVWAQALGSLVRVRLDMGLDWSRAALILGAVLAATLAALALTASKRGGLFFHKDKEQEGYKAALFLLPVVLLALARQMSPLPVLLADRFLPSLGLGLLEILALGLYAVFVGGKLLDAKRARRVRPLIWSLFSLVFFLQLGLGLLGMERLLMTGNLHLPVPALILGGPLYRGEGIFMLVLFASSILLLGPGWCSWLCYIGAWDDLSSKRGRLKARPAGRSPGKLLWVGRGATLLATVATALALRAAGVSPLGAGILAGAFGLAGVGIMLFFSTRRGIMVHCTTYCPMGLVGNLLGRLSPWRLRVFESCTNCGACARFCRYGALEPEQVATGKPGLSCTLCGDCLPSCHAKALGYRFPGLSPEFSRKAFLVMAVGLHTLFLGTARM